MKDHRSAYKKKNWVKPMARQIQDKDEAHSQGLLYGARFKYKQDGQTFSFIKTRELCAKVVLNKYSKELAQLVLTEKRSGV